MKNLFKSGFIALAISLTIAACNNRNTSEDTSGTDTAGTMSQDGSSSALDSTSTDTLGTTGNDSIQ